MIETTRGAGRGRFRTAAAAALVALLAAAPSAGAAARRGDEPAAPPETAGCVGPFTAEETRLYEELAAAQRRVEAAEAAVSLREQLLLVREAQLVQRHEELVALQEAVEERLAALEKDEKRLARAADDLAEREEAERTPAAAAVPTDRIREARKMNAAQLAVMVRSMKPDAAGQLLTQLPSGLSTEVLSRLPARKAGRILSRMDPEAASGLSVAFVHRQPAPKADDGGAGGTR